MEVYFGYKLSSTAGSGLVGELFGYAPWWRSGADADGKTTVREAKRATQILRCTFLPSIANLMKPTPLILTLIHFQAIIAAVSTSRLLMDT